MEFIQAFPQLLSGDMGFFALLCVYICEIGLYSRGGQQACARKPL